jgi:hypothetical protein
MRVTGKAAEELNAGVPGSACDPDPDLGILMHQNTYLYDIHPPYVNGLLTYRWLDVLHMRYTHCSVNIYEGA